MKVNRKYLLLALISGFLVTVDQLTKMYIHTQFQLGEHVTVIENYFNITYVRNMGAAFGLLHDSHATFRTIFFLSVPPIAMIIILFILRGVPESDRLQVFALSAIFGGAIGNYIDRLRFGYVIDFLDFHWRNQYAWPAFNVADSSIVLGVAILTLIMGRGSEKKKLEA